MIRVVLAGARGRVGRALEPILKAAADIDYAGALERGPEVAARLAALAPQAVVDFTHPDSALEIGMAAVAAGAAPIIGTSGLPDRAVDRLERACGKAGVGGVVAPNFAVGAVLMMWLAERAAPHFEAVEVIEMHHAAKADAPSATALATARRLAAAGHFAPNPAQRLTLAGSRGGEEGGVGLHSVRLPGVLADQEVIFGLPGQTLTIAHRTTSRESFAPGVLLAIRRTAVEARFHRGLEALLGLG